MNGGHPQGKKNVVRSIEEKEQIVLEYLNGKVGYRAIARIPRKAISINIK